MEDRELELFKKYRLDPEKVRFYRARLENIPPAPLEELHRKRDRLASLLAQLNTLHSEAMEICDGLESLQVHCYCWEGLLNSVGTFGSERRDHPRAGSQGGPFDWWDLLNDKWDSGFCPQHRVVSEYCERPPNKKQGARSAWNSFVVAFRRAPERMFYGSGDGYYAIYRDAKFQTLCVQEESLLERRVGAPAANGA